MRRGDVWWHERTGVKRRPVVILTRDVAIDRLNKLIAAPITTTVRGIGSEVKVGPEDGLRHESAVNLDNTTLIDKNELRERIATLGPDRLRDLCHALDAATGCD
jgi:mRNA interferase MazF